LDKNETIQNLKETFKRINGALLTLQVRSSAVFSTVSQKLQTDTLLSIDRNTETTRILIKVCHFLPALLISLTMNSSDIF
jgi:hypothetical protein